MSSGASVVLGLDYRPLASMATKEKRKLLELLAKHAYAYSEAGFLLASGKLSKEYLECRMALSQPEALAPLGKVFLSHIDPRADAVGGLTMGADPIAIATARASCDAAGHRLLRWFSVRKDAKEHGKKKLIEGDVRRGNKVVIVDDVVTTGGSTVQAIEKCRDSKLDVVQVLVLVDREQDDGMKKIRAAAGSGVSVKAVFSKSEVRAEWQAHHQTRSRKTG
jgi:orotate phosphoribosyltransferase